MNPFITCAKKAALSDTEEVLSTPSLIASAASALTSATRAYALW